VKLLNNKKRRIRLLQIFLTLLIVFEMGTYTSTITRPSEKFFQFYVLGSDQSVGNYYPNNLTRIVIGENIRWNLGLVNDMGSVQFVSIRVKVGNQTIDAPNDTMALPSPAPFITEFKHFMQNNETWQIPFDWQIANAATTPDGHVRIQELTIDNQTYALNVPLTCSSMNSCSFRLIFELWTWNVDSADFQFGWWNGNQQQIAWLQVWFSLTTVKL
jgi:hypothetical protein